MTSEELKKEAKWQIDHSYRQIDGAKKRWKEGRCTKEKYMEIVKYHQARVDGIQSVFKRG